MYGGPPPYNNNPYGNAPPPSVYSGPPQGQYDNGPPQTQGYGAPPMPQQGWNGPPQNNQWGGPPQSNQYGGPPPQQQWNSGPPQSNFDGGNMNSNQYPPYNGPERGPQSGYGQMGPGYQPPGGGGGYNLPPSGPGPQGHLPMGHGPSPYQNGTPPIQQEGSGMTPEGGRKRAVICGCNYKGSSAALNGCINDAQCMKYLLTSKFGFRSQDIILLTDDQASQDAWPTRANMSRQMQRLVHDARPGDSLIFHFSGHGSQTKDWSGDERDGMNETLCPCDFKQAGQIVDDELNQLLVNPLPPGVRLHAIIDACHSGSMLDLEVQAECKNGDSHWRNEYKKRPKRYKGTRGGEAIQFGAARDSQTAADTAALSGHVSTGAATFSFIQAIERAGTNISYGRLLQEMDVNLAGLKKGAGGGSSSGFGGLTSIAGSLLGGGSSSGGGGLSSIAGALLGGSSGGGAGGGGYKGQTPVLSSNQPFDLNRMLHI